MKKIKIILSAIIIVAAIACSNGTAEKKDTLTTAANDVEAKGGIVGTWIPIGLDFNLDGKTTPSGDWHFNTKQDSLNVKEAGLTFEDGNFNFKTNGTAYMGKAEPKESDAFFKYKKISAGKWCIDDTDERNTNPKNIDVFYIDANDRLIHHTSTEPTLLGKKTLQNNFELYKRK